MIAPPHTKTSSHRKRKKMSKRTLPFIDHELSPEFVRALRLLNPWWEGNPMPPQPHTRRHLVAQIRRRLDAEIAPIVAVRGPRQVGKSTVQLHIIADLLAEGVLPTSILRVPFDELPALKTTE